MMMSATGQGTQNPAIDSKLPYKWDEPTLVARTSISPLVFVVKGDSPWRSLREVIDDVKKDPAKFNTAHQVRAASAASRCRCCSAATESMSRSSAASRCRAAHRCSTPSPPARPTLPRNISPRWVRSSQARSSSPGRQHADAGQAAAGHAHLTGGGLRHLHADRLERDRRSVATAGRHRRQVERRDQGARRGQGVRRGDRSVGRRSGLSRPGAVQEHAQGGIRDGGAARDEAGVAEIARIRCSMCPYFREWTTVSFTATVTAPACPQRPSARGSRWRPGRNPRLRNPAKATR